MRIAHVTATFPPDYSGTGMVCYHNALGLAGLGHQVTVFTASHPSGGSPYSEGVTIRRLAPLFRLGNAPFLPKLWEELKNVDLIHLHHPFIFGSEMIWAISKVRKIPYIITHHNDLIGKGLRRYLFNLYSAVSTRLIFDGAHRLAVVSLDHAMSSHLEGQFRRRWPRVVELPNGVDVELFRPDLDGKLVRRRYNISDKAQVILFVGALDRAHHYRRVDLLIEAVKAVQEPDLYLLLAGSGDQLVEYQNLAQRLGVSSQVHFLGKVANQTLPEVYASADVVVLPSHLQEAFPLVLLEAMACGKPVIASNLPGVRSMVDHGENGFLVRPADVTDLVEKIGLLLASPQQRQEMGARGRAKVEAKYAWPEIIRQLTQIYEEVLAV